MKVTNIDVSNFKEFTLEEHLFNLKRLDIYNYGELIGKEVYYCKPSYGIHVVESWNPITVEYILNLDGCRFTSNPFRILIK